MVSALFLATQNPVDLDYKGLSNAGTWFIGRLQTERDKERLMDGLEGASAGAFDRASMDQLLSGLTSRVFLMSNAHEDAPVLFQTRWALSYLAGPLTGKQIARLTADRPGTAPAESIAEMPRVESISPPKVASPRPTIPADIEERFLPVMHPPLGDQSLVYRPALAATATLHYANVRAQVDSWQDVTVLAALTTAATTPWQNCSEIQTTIASFDTAPQGDARFSVLPPAAANPKSYVKWKKMLGSHLYRERPLRLWRCRKPRLVSSIGESEGDFRVRLRDSIREQRDLDIEKLRRRYAPKLAKLQERIQTAERRLEVEQEQYSQKKTQTAISIGATVVGALFGRKLGRVGNLGRATTAMRGAGRAARERGDISRAADKIGALRGQLKDLERDFQDDVEEHEQPVDVDTLDIAELRVTCRKTDLDISALALVWTPWRVGSDGIAEPAYET